jgi:hypothetical protein
LLALACAFASSPAAADTVDASSAARVAKRVTAKKKPGRRTPRPEPEDPPAEPLAPVPIPEPEVDATKTIEDIGRPKNADSEATPPPDAIGPKVDPLRERLSGRVLVYSAEGMPEAQALALEEAVAAELQRYPDITPVVGTRAKADVLAEIGDACMLPGLCPSQVAIALRTPMSVTCGMRDDGDNTVFTLTIANVTRAETVGAVSITRPKTAAQIDVVGPVVLALLGEPPPPPPPSAPVVAPPPPPPPPRRTFATAFWLSSAGIGAATTYGAVASIAYGLGPSVERDRWLPHLATGWSLTLTAAVASLVFGLLTDWPDNAQ